MWIERELAKRLGLDPDKVHPVSREQQFFNQIAGAKVAKPDGSGMEPLVTITEQDIAELKVKGTRSRGLPATPSPSSPRSLSGMTR